MNKKVSLLVLLFFMLLIVINLSQSQPVLGVEKNEEGCLKEVDGIKIAYLKGFPYEIGKQHECNKRKP